MAFRPLTEAECGQANPLSKLTSHITRDHTFSDNHGQVFQSSSDQLVEQFLQESRAVPQTYRMDDLMREMHEIESQRSALPPIPASTVKDQLHDNAWALQYIEDGKRFNDVYNNENVWAEIISQEQREYGIEAIANTWTNEILNNPAEQTNSFLPEEALEDIGENSQYVYSKFMRFMKEEGNGTMEEGKLTEQEAADWTKEYFEAEGQEKSPAAVAQKWSEEHQQAQSSKDDEFNSEFWNKLQEEFKKVSEADVDPAQPWIDEFNSYYNTNTKEYEFSDENPMLEIPKPLEKGKEFLDLGDFPSAVLCFEAAVKQEPENVEAWLLLGTTQAENEQDPNAISALNKCLQLEPTNLKALMALAVSYTNESYYNQACQMLLNWLKYNSKYQELIPPNFKLSGQVTSLLVQTDHKAIQDLYIKAAQRNPQHVDYEVQCGLGVLFNLTSEYNKAADCFTAALSVKPDDARLWNRLGATLANGMRPEEAVDAYHHALNLSPGFIRARYNVGITCINLNAYREAAEHFLTALNQQARGKDVMNSGSMSQMSDTIWSTLRMCVSLMNRGDLKPFVDKRDLKELNKAFGID
ncbi:peroxisomal targeting signal 1 receptor isoform X1 [Diorhabda carinulata]|uniref:peroxisomal targeting signal 1 receptor isoform X1 n=1 Tax=Diorhabda carinulata TaxID=1163345 RepID=UPI0025A0514A|nr:peroxisomal targeting signal 1 receptor isoform X1 [Diorhabda carinulata]